MASTLGVATVHQYEKGVVFRLGKFRSVREPGMRFMIPFVDVLQKVSLRTVTMPRNLQVLGEIAIEKNSTILFPAPFMDSLRAVTQFLEKEHSTVAPEAYSAPQAAVVE